MSDLLFERVAMGCLVLGTVERRYRQWAARGPDWQEIGIYPTRRDALDAVWLAHIAEPTLALIYTEAASFELH